MKDAHGKAILDYLHGNEEATLLLHNNYGEPEEMPAAVFFRDEFDFTTLEHLALIECKGKVLDVGAGAGALAIVLQERGFDVHALENSEGCIQAMKQIGVQNIINSNFEKHTGKYDTVLVQMNGLGLAGTLANVPSFLKKCMSLLNSEGQLIIDSSDISYLYEDELPEDSYFGEVQYCYEYTGEMGDWFDWVYVDPTKLMEIVNEMGLSIEILTEENDQFLARIIQ